MTSQPKLLSVQPGTWEANRGLLVVLKGTDFVSGITATINSTTYATTFVSSGELQVQVAAPGQPAGTYNLQLQNPDGGYTNVYPVEILGTETLYRDRWRKKEVDQRTQPLDVPHRERSDTQRIAAGTQFAGGIPNAAQGRWLGASAPTTGGAWTYNDDVIVNQLHFRSNGTEGVARGAGSGFYVYRKTGVKQLLLDLASTAADVALLNNKIYLDKGETLVIETLGATLEMSATVVVDSRKPSYR